MKSQNMIEFAGIVHTGHKKVKTKKQSLVPRLGKPEIYYPLQTLLKKSAAGASSSPSIPGERHY